MTTLHKILVPLDDTELGLRTLDVALRNAAAFQSHVVLLRVLSQPAALEIGDTDRDLDAIDDESHRLVAVARDRAVAMGLSVPDISIEVRAGGIVDAIVGAAEDTMCDLIVMGTHGRSGISDAITGSTTERVLNRASASVLAVKPVGFPYLRDEGPAGR